MNSHYDKFHVEVLRLISEHELSKAAVAIKSHDIAIKIGLSITEVNLILDKLESHGYVGLSKADQSNYGVWMEQPGIDQMRNLSHAKPSETHYNIGAIIQVLSGSIVQAVAVAHDTDISQTINDVSKLETQMQLLTDRLIEVVESELDISALRQYTDAVTELQEELLSHRPDQSVIQKFLRTLAFFGDVEGTIGLMQRVWPYVSSMLIIASQILRP